jgi:peptidoglycan/LPS O-acetylase OafA/YrhL
MHAHETKRAELRALTGFRFFAAIYVVWLHFAPLKAGLAATFIGHGGASVKFFFMLSGFILTYVHDQSSELDASARRTFWVARFARIYPVYALAFLLFTPSIYTSLVMLHGHSTQTASRMVVYGIASLTLLQAWSTKLAYGWNPPGWSLSAEAFFYAFFPHVLVRLRRLPLRRVVCVGVLLWVIAFLPHLIASAFPGKETAIGGVDEIVEFMPIFRIAEFIGGMVLARIFLEKPQVSDFASRVLWLTLVALLVTLLFCPSRYIGLLIFPEFALLILGLSSSAGWLSRIAGAQPLHLLGEASYSVYILQAPVHFLYFEALGAPRSASGFGLFLSYQLVLICVAIATFHLVEKPANRAIRRVLLGGWHKKMPQGTSVS